jgi:hypothetical protein
LTLLNALAPGVHMIDAFFPFTGLAARRVDSIGTATQPAGPQGPARMVTDPGRLQPLPRLLDDDATCASVRWDDAAALLDGLRALPG